MTTQRRLLMIPGPIEVSPAVGAAYAAPPPGHLSPEVIEAFGASLGMMRRVWLSAPGSQPFLFAGSGTNAMEMAVANLIEPGDAAVVVNTGFFSDRMVDMLRRARAEVVELTAVPGEVPNASRADVAITDLKRAGKRVKALFATHVDTSTGALCDPKPLAALARSHEVLSVFDGVCATAGERFEMEAWEADVYLTASQKAIGLPPGLALLVASERALAARDARREPPPLSADWRSWIPVMQAYEARQPAYFATPPTNLVLALRAGLAEILAEGMEARFALHVRGAAAMRVAWSTMGLRSLPARESCTAHTLSALYFPEGVDAALVGRVAQRGVSVAGGLHPALRGQYFRVGHMGYTLTRPDMMMRTVEAIGGALEASGHAVETEGAVKAMLRALQTAPV